MDKLDVQVLVAGGYPVEQMALDASALLSRSKENFEAYAGAGFFRRLWYAVNGRNRQVISASVQDLAQMQRIAFTMLDQLQQRDMLHARDLAIVRNNLLALVTEQVDLRDGVEALVGKLKASLRSLREDVALLKWNRSVPTKPCARHAEPLQRFLAAVVDLTIFLLEKGIEFDEAEVAEALGPALAELDLDPHATYSLPAFIGEVLGGFTAETAVKVAAMPLPLFEREEFTAADIRNHVGSLVSVAVFSLWEGAAKVAPALPFLGPQVDIGAMRESIAKEALAEAPADGPRLTLVQIGCELIVASLIAIEGPRVEESEDEEIVARSDAPQEEARGEPPVQRGPVLARHAFLEMPRTREQLDAYVSSFGNLFVHEGVMPDHARLYLREMCRLFGCEPGVVETAEAIAKSGQPDVQAVRELMALPAEGRSQSVFTDVLMGADGTSGTTWLLDACFVANGCGEADGGPGKVMRAAVEGNARLTLSLKSWITAVACSTDPQELLAACREAHFFSEHWRALLDYRGIRLDAPIEDVIARTKTGAIALALKLGRLRERSDKLRKNVGSLIANTRDKEKFGMFSDEAGRVGDFEKEAKSLLEDVKAVSAEQAKFYHDANGVLRLANMNTWSTGKHLMLSFDAFTAKPRLVELDKFLPDVGERLELMDEALTGVQAELRGAQSMLAAPLVPRDAAVATAPDTAGRR